MRNICKTALKSTLPIMWQMVLLFPVQQICSFASVRAVMLVWLCGSQFPKANVTHSQASELLCANELPSLSPGWWQVGGRDCVTTSTSLSEH